MQPPLLRLSLSLSIFLRILPLFTALEGETEGQGKIFRCQCNYTYSVTIHTLERIREYGLSFLFVRLLIWLVGWQCGYKIQGPFLNHPCRDAIFSSLFSSYILSLSRHN